MDDRRDEGYEQPEVEDLGNLPEMTQATGLVGPEDGGNKLLIHHESLPLGP